MYEKIRNYIIVFITAFIIGMVASCIYSTGRSQAMENRITEFKSKLATYEESSQVLTTERENLRAKISGLSAEIESLRIRADNITKQSKEIGSGLSSLSEQLGILESGLSNNQIGNGKLLGRLSEIIEGEESSDKGNNN